MHSWGGGPSPLLFSTGGGAIPAPPALQKAMRCLLVPRHRHLGRASPLLTGNTPNANYSAPYFVRIGSVYDHLLQVILLNKLYAHQYRDQVKSSQCSVVSESPSVV